MSLLKYTNLQKIMLALLAIDNRLIKDSVYNAT